ncbi:MAG: RimK domain protein ATP-grasp [Candidatus Giovannonibacteria bacterium GW2011_GWC2_44_9]|uniref:RimK domain protein ATP-grasp n=3 Tax=Candidatus Giovannoniibacteriota TaxID=1752738 RepID=A0A0G1LUF4_9BACT|nr:MAG: RimK domain protein ATP-grasp [Candidatus Giovannonibacteria bacterium GW2011_GWB1_44_23]KKT63339.1 MAG: RimK domain protein ATP-grasp [Candidatus Giovannonibacteria bacterium GW2011_GWA1_44_29]KKT83229.1 MAG: RimK domain protein ATP-grasp [Candidatus Giovannonibacteria bacterium GW2011_GWC2_44_9]KKT91543.1 MAG: RimK domain protein ATP-grasp [Parcubacteria group bacterium GW2011_GWC1_45_13]
MRDKILIVTDSNELNVPEVQKHLVSSQVLRLNTDQLVGHGLTLQVEKGEIDFLLTCGMQTISANNIKAVWYRRPSNVTIITEKLTENHRKYAENENQRFLMALWNSADTNEIVWVNHPSALRKLEHSKPLQLHTADQVGLATPATLITNCLDAVKEFFDCWNGAIVAKTFGSHTRNDSGWPISVFTTPITRDGLEKFGHELRYAPVIFQNYIPKKLELRITVVGHRIFSCAIHSQDSKRTMYDWRRYDFGHVKHEPCELPPEIVKKLLQAMRIWDLQFGAIDMILTPKGDYVFLEVNPSGQWGWIEAITGMPISKAIADLLVDPTAYSNRP